MAIGGWLRKLTGRADAGDAGRVYSIVLLLRNAGDLTEDAIQAAAEAAFPEIVERKGPGAIIALQSESITIVRAGEDMIQVLQAAGPYSDGRIPHSAWIAVDYLRGKPKTARHRKYIIRRLAALASELAGPAESTPVVAVYFVDDRVLVPFSDELKGRMEYFEKVEELFRQPVEAVH